MQYKRDKQKHLSGIDLIKNFGLYYTNEDELCFIRKRKGGKFIYINFEGSLISDKKLIDRFESLVIPPAWENVRICSHEYGHIQATGRDSKGRKQYIYHPQWHEFRNTNKFNKIIEFGKSLPLIRKRIERDLKKRSLIRDKVLAVIIKLLEGTLIRVGNEIYVEQNNSYGLTTLKDKHLEIKGFTLNFNFNGKGGKSFKIAIKDKTLANIAKKCQDLPGQRLFQYIDEIGIRRIIESIDVNNYLNKIVEKNFTAKDFRTWGATVIAAKELYKLPLSEDVHENNRKIVKAIKQTAEKLNNTPSICKKYYLHPAVIKAYLDGILFKEMNKTAAEKKSKYGLDKEEKVVLKILEKYSGNNGTI